MFAIAKNGGKCRNFDERSQIKVFLVALYFQRKRYFWHFLSFGVIFFASMSELRLLTYFKRINIAPSTFLKWSGKNLWPSSSGPFLVSNIQKNFLKKSCLTMQAKSNRLRWDLNSRPLDSNLGVLPLSQVHYIKLDF